jgi:predicted dehydrogenase
MSQQMKCVVIGVGRATNSQGTKGGGHQIGYTHAQMFRRSPQCRLVAGLDINADNLAAFNQQFGLTQGYADLGAMLSEVRPDVVSIGTYVGLHRSIIEQCARAGVKGIVCEKPFLNAPADVAPVRKVVEATGVKVVVAHIRRYRPAFERVRELLSKGAIGEPVACLTSLGGWDLSEMGAHWFDLIRFFNGDDEVKWVLGQARVRATRGYGHAMEDHAIAHFGFANGLRGIIEAGQSLNAGHDFTFTLIGAKGVVRAFNEMRLSIETASGYVVEDFAERHPIGWDKLGIAQRDGWLELWDMMLADLLGWLAGRAAPRVGWESALRTLEVNQAAYVSAIRGDRVDLPLQADEIAEYPVDVLARRGG